MIDTLERRVTMAAWPDERYELRAMPGGDGMTFTGYAAVFDQTSEDLGGFREIIAPGAFTRSLAQPERDIKMFWNHDAGRLLASASAGSLRLREDAVGLHVEARLPDTTDGRDMAELIRTGNVRSMSFGFTVAPTDLRWDAGRTVRTVVAADLFEVSPVTGWPAYRGTSANVRDLGADDMARAFWPPTSDQIAEALGELISDPTWLTPHRAAVLRRVLSGPHRVKPVN